MDPDFDDPRFRQLIDLLADILVNPANQEGKPRGLDGEDKEAEETPTEQVSEQGQEPVRSDPSGGA